MKSKGLDVAHPPRSRRAHGLRRGQGLAAAATVALAAAFFPGCGGGEAKRESAALAEAVDRYRTAADASKQARAQGVSALPCTNAAVCAAKRLCLGAMAPTTQALALKDEVTERLNDLEQKRLAPDSPEADALPAKLDQATRMLEQGRANMAACNKSLIDLRLQFGG